ncbi:ABC-2 transporter permease [Calidifontibacillus oryziterrae]|uniref:ABC transporter permease n=1 Tax=Calidifontibacillus oryziterrae TaxID=1191699 RepID=UPI00030A45C6|nr:ABC transporter permease [Calidifontibacillus oryziterrae]
MSNLIRAELYKLQRNKTFWVLFGTVAGLSGLLHFLVIIDWWQLTGTEFDQAGLSELNALSPFTIPLFFNLIVSSLAGFYISTEFSQSSVIKNQVISGNKRSHIYIAKYLVFSLGASLVTIVIPLLTAIIMVSLFGYGEILNASNLMYLGRAFSLFALQFLCFTAIVLLIAIVTEDSGKTIIFTLLLSIIMFAIEKLFTFPIVRMVYENTFFFEFTEVFKVMMTNDAIIKAILIGSVSLIVISLCGMFVFNRKEIK